MKKFVKQKAENSKEQLTATVSISSSAVLSCLVEGAGWIEGSLTKSFSIPSPDKDTQSCNLLCIFLRVFSKYRKNYFMTPHL